MFFKKCNLTQHIVYLHIAVIIIDNLSASFIVVSNSVYVGTNNNTGYDEKSTCGSSTNKLHLRKNTVSQK